MSINEVNTARVVALIQDGRSQRYVAQSVGIAQSCVRRTWGRFLETGSYSRRPGTGRQRCTSVRDDRLLTLAILRNRTTTAVEVRNALLKFEMCM
jgi:transposase